MRVQQLIAGPALVAAALLAAILLAHAPGAGTSGSVAEVAQQDGHALPASVSR